MKKFVIIGLALALGACAATPEEQASSMEAVQSKLPEGCTLTYAGNAEVAGSRYPSRIFFVKCGDVTTISETHNVTQGKTTYARTDVTVIQ
jgi:hypothetical protein